MTMRQAELIAVRRFQIAGREIEEPGPGEVQVRVHFVGACGSDLHCFSEGGIGDQRGCFPMVLGHEPSGIVLKTGSGVTGWSPGDRAALEPSVFCHQCEFCRSGRHNLCTNLRFFSTEAPGFFREVVNLPAENLLAIPPVLSLRDATLFEPLSIALHSLRLAPIQKGETAAVFGAGPIGLLTIAALKLFGAARVWAVEPVAARRELDLRVGAYAAIDPAATNPESQVMSDTGNRGVHIAFDCATKGSSLNQALRVCGRGGRVVLTGIPSEVLVPLEFHVMRRKELALFNVRRSNQESEAALELLGEHPDCFLPIITHVQPLEQIEPGFRTLEQYADGIGKLVIDIS
jgi:L-iditol 2-dehydrogenase